MFFGLWILSRHHSTSALLSQNLERVCRHSVSILYPPTPSPTHFYVDVISVLHGNCSWQSSPRSHGAKFNGTLLLPSCLTSQWLWLTCALSFATSPFLCLWNHSPLVSRLLFWSSPSISSVGSPLLFLCFEFPRSQSYVFSCISIVTP